jgi:hypothetical protein
MDEPDSKLEMPGINAAFLVVARGVAREFEDLGGKVFKNGSEID